MSMTQEQAQDALAAAMYEGAEAFAALYPDVDREALVLSVTVGKEPRVVLTQLEDGGAVLLFDCNVFAKPSH